MVKILSIICVVTLLFSEQGNIKNESISKQIFVLQVNEKQEEIIREIILTMARCNPLKLGFKKKHLSALGKKLKGLGSLHFLGYVGSNDDLRDALFKISRSSLKWNGFVNGMKKGLNRACEQKTMQRDLPGFSILIQVEEKVLKQHVEKKDWSGFIGEVATPLQEKRQGDSEKSNVKDSEKSNVKDSEKSNVKDSEKEPVKSSP